jgi:hypothetical protein
LSGAGDRSQNRRQSGAEKAGNRPENRDDGAGDRPEGGSETGTKAAERIATQFVVSSVLDSGRGDE